MTRILVIEDSEAIRNVVTCALDFEGYETKSAERAEEGLALAKSWQPDLTVCDICLPQQGGYHVLEEMRGMAELQTMPFIFLSAKSQREDVRMGMNLGADDYITKPFQIEELISSVKSQLEKRQRLFAVGSGLSNQVPDLGTWDEVTRLPGRRELRRAIDGHVGGPQERERLSLLVLDLDNYRGLRDALESAEVNRVLQEAVGRMQNATDQPLYRIDSDAFAVLDQRGSDKSKLGNLARQLQRALNAPFETSLGHCYLNINIGISFYPKPSNDRDSLVANAEFAAAQAKQSGRGYYRIYQPESALGSGQQLALETHLRLARQRNELVLHYQPKIDLNGHHTLGVEALLRWHSPDLGFMGPASFLPATDELGMLAAFSNWALEHACHQMATLHQRGFEHLSVAVNAAPRQLLDPHFPEFVQRMLDESGLPANRLELEITENLMFADESGIRERLFKLKDLGISLSLDDFGTGYSSLAHLQQFPVDVLKIDRSFIQGLTKITTDDTIVISVIEMSRKLGLKVIAEGVETVQQLRFLQAHGCDGVQGYLFCGPLSANNLLEFLEHPHGDGCPACDPERWSNCHLCGLGLGCPPP